MSAVWTSIPCTSAKVTSRDNCSICFCFYGLPQSSIRILKEGFPLSQNIHYHICINQKIHCLANRSSLSTSSTAASCSGIIPTRLSNIASLSIAGLVRRAIFFPFLVIKISCLAANSRYFPRLLLNSVAVTTIRKPSLQNIVQSLPVYIIQKSNNFINLKRSIYNVRLLSSI